jgi:hypothetical protein
MSRVSPVKSVIGTLDGAFFSTIIVNAPLVAAAAAVPVVKPVRSFLFIYFSIYQL